MPPALQKPTSETSPAGLARLAGVVVHWRNEAELTELLSVWPDDPRFELVIVDNQSDGSLTPEERPGLRWILSANNLGFAGGANLGVASTSAPIVLLLNPDARPEEGALASLLDGFDAYPGAAGLAPRLLGPDGESQWRWQLRSLPKPVDLLLEAFGRSGDQASNNEPTAGMHVEQPAACALAIRRTAWDSVGGMDEGFWPAWFEDVDLARRLAACGHRLRYWPAAQFQHDLGASVPKLGYGPFLWAYSRNLERYLGRHHGNLWRPLWRLAVLAGLALRGLALPLRKPHRAASRGQALHGLLEVGLGALSGWRLPRRLAARKALDER